MSETPPEHEPNYGNPSPIQEADRLQPQDRYHPRSPQAPHDGWVSEKEQVPEQRRLIHESSSISNSLKLALFLWARIIRELVPILVPVVLFMWVYYLPAVVLTDQLLDGIKMVLYDRLRGFLSLGFYYTPICLVYVYVYSLRFSRNALLLVVLPCVLLDFILRISLRVETLWKRIFINVCAILAGSLSLYVIRKSKEPKNMSNQQRIYFELTKDGTPSQMIKSICALFFFIALFIQYFLPFLVSFTPMKQLIFRLFLFPFVFHGVKSYQIYVIYDLSMAHMDKRLIVNRISNLYITFIGRVVVSNITTGSDMGRYVLINSLVVVLDILTTITFKERTIIFYKTKTLFWDILSSVIKTNKVSDFNPCEIEESQIDPPNALDHQDEYVQKCMHIRSLTLCYDIAYEIVVSVVAPLLMYFVDRIYPDSSFNTIPSFQECVLQIAIQIIFLFFKDFVSIAFEIHRGSINYNAVGSEKFRHLLASIFILLYSVMSIQFFISFT